MFFWVVSSEASHTHTSPLVEWKPGWFTRNRWLSSRSLLLKVLIIGSAVVLALCLIDYGLDPTDTCDNSNAAFRNMNNIITLLTIVFFAVPLLFVLYKLSIHVRTLVFVLFVVVCCCLLFLAFLC